MNCAPDNIVRAIHAYLSALANPVRAGTYVGYIRPLNHGTLADSYLKCSEEMFNEVKKAYCVAKGLNLKTGANMARARKLDPEQHTKADIMRHHLRAQPDLTRQGLGELYGDAEMFASSQFSTLRSEVKAELKQTKKAKKSNGVDKNKGAAFVTTTKAVTEMTSEVEQLRHDNAYLKWQLTGERLGFFERWLEENDG